MTRKKPTVNRSLARCHGDRRAAMRMPGLLLLGLLVVPSSASAENPVLTEDQALRIALDQPETLALVHAQIERADGRAALRNPWSNPTIGYQHEHLPGDELEQSLVIAQNIDLSGRRGMWRRAARERGRSAQLSGRAARARLAAEIRTRFYTVLYRQRRAEQTQAPVRQLTRALAIVRARETAGDVSAYDRQRLERELLTARLQHEREAMHRERAWLGLAGLLELPDEVPSWPRVRGVLTPAEKDPQAAADDLSQATAERPDVRALDALAGALALEEKTAHRGWIPSLGVSLGWRRMATQNDQRHGFVAGLSLSLPIFNRGQWRGQVARAQRQQTMARKRLLMRQARSQLQAARAYSERLTSTARQFHQDSQATAAQLIRTAEAGYAGGELRLLELLDAYRSVSEDALRAIDLAYAARLARIDLRRALGQEKP